MEYRLHVFIESLCNNIQESYPKNIKENFVLHSPIFIWNTGEYGGKKKKKNVFTEVLCSDLFDFLI